MKHAKIMHLEKLAPYYNSFSLSVCLSVCPSREDDIDLLACETEGGSEMVLGHIEPPFHTTDPPKLEPLQDPPATPQETKKEE